MRPDPPRQYEFDGVIHQAEDIRNTRQKHHSGITVCGKLFANYALFRRDQKKIRQARRTHLPANCLECIAKGLP